MATFAQPTPQPEATLFMAYGDDSVDAEGVRVAAMPITEDAPSAPSEDTFRAATTTDDDAFRKKEQKRDAARARAVRTVMDRRIKQAEEAVARATERRSKESIDAAKERLEYAKKLQEEAHKDEKALVLSEEAATEAVTVIERIVREENLEQRDEDDREHEDARRE
jgi:hypothetical protein